MIKLLSKHQSHRLLTTLLFLLLGFNITYSQQLKDSLHILDAVILTSDSLLPVENAHVISKFNRWGTISNKDGRFKLYVQNYDSVLITSMGFSPVVLQIDSSVLSHDGIVQIQLPKDTLSINEVVIRAYWDYKTMKQIVINMQPIDLSQFYPDWEGTELLYMEPHPMSFKGPIQAFYDAFNRSARLQRQLIKNRKEYNKVMYMMGRYLDTIPAKPEHMQGLPD
jgi:hypothetical protein